jgi:hypothetical protein
MTTRLRSQKTFYSLLLNAAAVSFALTLTQAAAQNPGGIEQQRGMRINTDQAAPGYVLFSPAISGTTYLVNTEGQVVNTWQSDYGTGHGLCLLDNGDLMRTARFGVARHNRGTPNYDSGKA